MLLFNQCLLRHDFYNFRDKSGIRLDDGMDAGTGRNYKKCAKNDTHVNLISADTFMRRSL